MADDKVKVATSKLTALADAIRAKSGGSEEITLNDISTVITTEIVNELTSITFTLPPKDYKTGDPLDLTGMSVIAHYSHVSDKDVTSVTTILPSAGSPLVTGNNTITASYTEKGITKTASVVVIVTKAAGTYDASDNLLKSWDKLLADGDVIVGYDDYLTTPNDRTTRFAGVKSIIIPDVVVSIGNNAFNGCTGLTSINIPDGVMGIGSNVFNGCTGLTSITIPDSVTFISQAAFEGCTGLTSITIPDGVTSIGNSAFKGCTGLTSITIPDGVTRINDNIFNGCTGLTSITIPDGVTNIRQFAFQNCTSLTSITIPNSVTTIGNNAFGNCTNLTTIHYSGTATGAPWGASKATVVR